MYVRMYVGTVKCSQIRWPIHTIVKPWMVDPLKQEHCMLYVCMYVRTYVHTYLSTKDTA